jgi:hypothetical protein
MKAVLKTGELEAELFVPLGVERRCLYLRPASVSIRQHTSAYVSIRQQEAELFVPLGVERRCLYLRPPLRLH